MATLQRVTLVTETYAPEVNGVAHTLTQLASGLRKQGIAVQIIRPRQHSEDLSFKDSNLSMVTLPGFPIPGYKSLRFGFPLIGRIANTLREFAPQAVYIATEGPMGYAAIKAARQLGITAISGFHTNFHQYIQHYRLAGLESVAYRYLRHFHNQTAMTLVPTRSQRDQLEAAGFRNVRVLSRGVDSQIFAPAHRREALRESWGVGKDDLVLLCVGRIAAEKNMELALTVYRRLVAMDNTVRLVLVGDGPELEHIRSRYPDVICCGIQRGQALSEHFASGDIFLFPSKTDTFGNVLTEAMASGLAVVSFDYAAAHEHVIHGETGMLAPMNDDAAFIERVETLVDSPNLLSRIRMQARQHAEGISWGNIINDFIQRLDGTNEKVSRDVQRKTVAKDRVTVQ